MKPELNILIAKIASETIEDILMTNGVTDYSVARVQGVVDFLENAHK